MMARLGLFLLALAAGFTGAPVVAAAPATTEKAAPVVWSATGETRLDMASTNTGRTYRVQIFKPLVPPPQGGYPVIYVTDGNGFFRLVADQMRVREFTDIKPAIVVAIGYPTDEIFPVVKLRMRDLIPEAPIADFMPVFDSWSKPVGGTAADAGGAEAFYRFITGELRPRLTAMMPVDAGNQAIYGHSLGGLFVLHVLFNHPEAFTTYIASSPSILVNNRSIVGKEAGFKVAVERGDVHPRVLLVVGSLENYPSSEGLAAMPADEQARWAKMGRAIDNTVEMATRLRRIKGPAGYEVKSHIFDGENHMSVVPASLSRALTFAFSTMPTP